MIVYFLTRGLRPAEQKRNLANIRALFMELFLDISQLVVGILLMAAVLLQSGRSGGLGSAFAGGDSVQITRRGAEKGLFNITVVLAAVFIGLAASRMFL
ncbi:MAG: preprotein translocase subunit SecG [Candidatus Kerfeldbacteria bacterium CG15_BIG_FIL_POST_REV_8_21_14_020_45_12]|uniref:Protein-export membrane protein SecG n=1 Tax=Candidatus Kerfeldbacteria bacterium CG15_BIG_FIL_POST_REV_8_21_14_020_45_12 TaxID=2014247 RepID=A0A2M7H2C1_9BACT|nr:MAG: preprotein translocase subunit SecG [Candidatus Kerfeldbacteria bacterium CG15_BIG_FIL_POST_REV_8_21_14_020_45_12]PJA93530.1 MAG: preprotein translocase subunit SecG [Candidatus Kerfeldbacteria bacterium CG_4_9_14_3_um_filter_45_8]